MAIREYIVTKPPNSGEVERAVLRSLEAGQTAARGILELCIRSEQQVPAPKDESISVRIMRPTLGETGSVQKIEGRGVINADTPNALESPSVIIELAEDPTMQAHARIVTII